MKKIMFVCTGNTCRSPMAAALADSIYGENGLFSFCSRGLSVAAYSRTSELAIKAMRKMDIVLEERDARQLELADVENSALIITMTASQKRFLERTYEECADKLATLSEMGGCTADIADPYGGGIREYERCAEQIKNLLGENFERKLSQLGE